MHSLVRRYLKTAIAFLIVGLAIGLWLMGERELVQRHASPYAASAHTHAILVGFVMMMILGVALWLFPRPASEDTRYDRRIGVVHLSAEVRGGVQVPLRVGAGLDAHRQRNVRVKVGDRVRLYVISAGPTHPCHFHVVGEQFDRVYLGAPPEVPLRGVQTFSVPAGGGMVFELVCDIPGEFPFVNHGFGHGQKGAIGFLVVE